MKSINNDLKFRVWDKKNKRFLSPYRFAILGSGHLIVSDNGWYDRFVDVDMDDYVVQRYTGMSDIKGKDIYEGDIVEFCDPYPLKKSDEWRTGTVISEGAKFYAKTKTGDFEFDLCPKIIGNILAKKTGIKSKK